MKNHNHYLPSVFENDSAKKRKEQKIHETELDELYAQIGKLTTQNERIGTNINKLIFIQNYNSG